MKNCWTCNKQTIYLAVWQAIKSKESEWSKIYERLVPIKCSYDERKRAYVGKGKIIGRIAGQMILVMNTLSFSSLLSRNENDNFL